MGDRCNVWLYLPKAHFPVERQKLRKRFMSAALGHAEENGFTFEDTFYDQSTEFWVTDIEDTGHHCELEEALVNFHCPFVMEHSAGNEYNAEITVSMGRKPATATLTHDGQVFVEMEFKRFPEFGGRVKLRPWPHELRRVRAVAGRVAAFNKKYGTPNSDPFKMMLNGNAS